VYLLAYRIHIPIVYGIVYREVYRYNKFITNIKCCLYTSPPYSRLYSFRFAVSDSHSDSNMKIDLCLAYKMPNYSVIYYAINLYMLINFILLQNIIIRIQHVFWRLYPRKMWNQEKSQKTDDQDANSCCAMLSQVIGNIIFRCVKQNTRCSSLISKIHSLLHYSD
jgi:hypothetical protein